jgi:LysM repeat protein
MLAALCSAGCQTMSGSSQQTSRQLMRQREEIRVVNEDIRRQAAQIEALETQLAEMQQGLLQMKNDLTDSLNRSIAAQNAAIETVNTARIRDREEIVRNLSAKIQELLAARSAAQPARPSGGGSSAYGIEHTVRPGETLWGIANAYKVTSKAIIQANQLKNPDALQVGQKIFIPQ